MATTATVPLMHLEDPLAYLPCSRILEYFKGQIVYTQQPASSLYLIIEGKVKVSRISNDGQRTVLDVYRKDEFFGETVFLGKQLMPEEAVAMEHTKLMSWSLAAVLDIMAREPKLGVGLLQLFAQRSVDLGDRVESFSIDNIARRLARSLIRFSGRLGEEREDGTVQMMPFTHEQLAQVVGTSREIVTHYMSQFRRQGYVRYSRKGISVYRHALQHWLSQPAM